MSRTQSFNLSLRAIRNVIFSLALMAVSAIEATAIEKVYPDGPLRGRPVDVVIALDVSNSMDGLINSAKQRLWDIVNELGSATPQPDLRVAILTYGNPDFGRHSGYVRLNMPFTRDLDGVSETLFGLRTNGGDEYVSRVVTRAVEALEWSSRGDGLRMIFVAGNEGAAQDPEIPYRTASKKAASKGIVVNTIFCGNSSNAETRDWRQVALLTDGTFSVINQDVAARAGIVTPWDDELLRLNQELNSTYIAYGKVGAAKREAQMEQDSQALGMSKAAAASRAVTKGSGMYRNSQWDLVDMVKEGKSVSNLAAEDLPQEMKAMDDEEREEFVEESAKKRQEIQKRIAQLDQQRREYIAAERKKTSAGNKGLDEALKDSIRQQAAKKGFTFNAK